MNIIKLNRLISEALVSEAEYNMPDDYVPDPTNPRDPAYVGPQFTKQDHDQAFENFWEKENFSGYEVTAADVAKKLEYFKVDPQKALELLKQLLADSSVNILGSDHWEQVNDRVIKPSTTLETLVQSANKEGIETIDLGDVIEVFGKSDLLSIKEYNNILRSFARKIWNDMDEDRKYDFYE